MNPSHDCFICQKHKNLEAFSGEIIAEQDGLVLVHFPYLEDEKATKGHLIIETRRHITDFAEMNDGEVAAFGRLVRIAVQVQKSRLKAEHVYLFRINDKVAHLHIHLVPRYAGTPKEYWGHGITNWPGRETVTLDEMRNLSRELRDAAGK